MPKHNFNPTTEQSSRKARRARNTRKFLRSSNAILIDSAIGSSFLTFSCSTEAITCTIQLIAEAPGARVRLFVRLKKTEVAWYKEAALKLEGDFMDRQTISQSRGWGTWAGEVVGVRQSGHGCQASPCTESLGPRLRLAATTRPRERSPRNPPERVW